MTLGERIQELRRGAGLSQEALGETLGVSRQAISKWEGDVTIPEVEKLIAMSRLFAVPVGVLLGVEAAAEPDSAAGEELSERELQAVEAITSRYLAEAEAKRPHRRKWPFVLVGIVLFFAAFNFFDSLRQMEERLNGLNSQLYTINDTLSSQIYGITGQVEDILNRQNSLVADWSWTLAEVLPQEDALVLALNLTPRQFPAGLEVQLSADVDGQTYTAPAEHQGGSAFTAQLRLPRSDEIKLSAVLVNGEERQTQVLEELTGLRTATFLTLRGDFGGTMSMDQPDSYIPGERVTAPMTWDGKLTLSVQPDKQFEGFDLRPVSAEFRVYRGNEAVEIRPLALSEDQDWTSPFQYELEVGLGDEIRLLFRVTDNHGQVTDFLVDSFVVTQQADRPGVLDIDNRHYDSHTQLETPFGM